MKAASASWLKGMNVNVAAILIAALTLAVSLLGFGLMVRAEMSSFRTEMSSFRSEIRADNAAFKDEIRADNAAFKAEIRSDIAEIRADNAAFKTEIRSDIAEIRADYKELGDKLDHIASVLDTRLDDIEREQARMQGVISVLQEAVAVVPRQPDDR